MRRCVIATVRAPFIDGGAERLAAGLAAGAREAGFQTEIVDAPFRYGDLAATERAMRAWRAEDFTTFDAGAVDVVVALKFPSYGLRHPSKRVWLLHQHRAAHELFGGPYGWPDVAETRRLREEIVAFDREALGVEAKAIRTLSRRVSERLRDSVGVEAVPLHHPPPAAELLRCGESLPYVVLPSRLEALKRQELLLRALALCPEPLAAVLIGEGGRREALQALIDELGLGARARLVGAVGPAELRAWYADARAVVFPPFDEDYGYVTLEAMLAGKPVVTCLDSGGPLEFVIDRVTGFVTEPTPAALGDALTRLARDPVGAARMGRAGRERYDSLGLSWAAVAHALLGPTA